MAFVRSANPIWFFVDHVGLPLNDTYYAFFMHNELPYLPAPVYQDSTGTPWPDPIELQPSGTLPDNLYFDPTIIYRIEIRQGNTQFGQLIWLIENYVPSGGGSTPISEISINTENVISNPQFAEILFTSPFTTSLKSFEIAPGWTLSMTGVSGSVTVTQLQFSGNALIPTNPSYGLEIVSNGWTNVTLTQTFANNGSLWTSEAVAMNFTAYGNSFDGMITGSIIYSDSTENTEIISDTLTNTPFAYASAATIPPSTNPDLPSTAFTAATITWASPATVNITSIQVVGQDIPNAIIYEQTPIERQVDHLFHYYKSQLETKPIPSYLVGWDFPLNPAQFFGDTVATQATGANKSYYAWDQTIIFQTVTSSVSVSRLPELGSLHLTMAVPGKIALIQYLSAGKAKELLITSIFQGISAYVQAATSPIRGMTLSLWWTANASLPSMLTNDSLVTGLDANGHPSVVTGWNEIPRINIGESNQFINTVMDAFESFRFPGFGYDSSAAATPTFFAIVIGTTALSAADAITFQSISVVPGLIPTIPAPQATDEVLRECQYYWRKSFLSGVTPATAVGTNSGESYSSQVGGAATANVFGPIVRFSTPMRTSPKPGAPNIGVILYNPVNADNQIQTLGVGSWSVSLPSSITQNGFVTSGTTPGGSSAIGQVAVHWTADARLGII